ncbi:MAG: sigma-70 family RNA polymerase sigma factor [Candidatus Omnitrophica bacterium]|nr:sigma-70 family RNA polymerase sigma factor [Candidatus Omnitrophota bacterium]
MDFKILLERISPALKYIARKHVLCGFYSQDDLYQEICLYLWQNYKEGLPIGINESYVIKGCEFHIQNFLRKGRPKAVLFSLDSTICGENLTLGDILEDKKSDFRIGSENRVTIDEIMKIGLTEKERSVLSYLLRGFTVREAAKELGISHVMVLKHKKNMIKKWKRRVTKV